MDNLIFYRSLTWLSVTTALLCGVSCNKIDYKGTNPYANAKAPLTIGINTDFISPLAGKPGTVVTLTGEDFSKYRDSGMRIKFNGVPGKIVKAGDSVLEVKVPEMASSGMITLTVLHQVFPGPVFQVKGEINIDPAFHAMPGADGVINCIQFVPGGKYIIGGSFDDYDNSGLVDGYHGIARINGDGTLDKSFTIGKGIQGTVNTIVVQADGKYIVGGNISNYNERFKPGTISNIVRLNADGSIDSMIVKNQSGIRDTVPSLNAYFDGVITKILQVPSNGKLVVIGDFTYFMQKDFTIPTLDGKRDSVRIDSIRMEGIARLNEDGSFDSTFNYDLMAGRSYEGANGPIQDALIQDDGKVVIVGNFTKYHNKKVSRIARLNSDGSLDASFDPGSGPDDRVFSVSRLQNGKYLVAGQFNQINGEESRKLAVLNVDGTLDQSFNIGSGPTAGPDGIILRAQALKNNKIFVTGFFNQFSGVRRGGTLVLNADGSISKTFNNLGIMEPSGSVLQILNVPTPEQATIIVGGFTSYDFKPVGHIALLKY